MICPSSTRFISQNGLPPVFRKTARSFSRVVPINTPKYVKLWFKKKTFSLTLDLLNPHFRLGRIKAPPNDFDHQRFVERKELFGHDDLVHVLLLDDEAEAQLLDETEPKSDKINTQLSNTSLTSRFGNTYFILSALYRASRTFCLVILNSKYCRQTRSRLRTRNWTASW